MTTDDERFSVFGDRRGSSPNCAPLGYFGATFGSWGHFWVTLGSLWGHFGVTLGSLWGHFVITLRALWGHFGVTLVTVWNQFGISLGAFLPGWIFLPGCPAGALPEFARVGIFARLPG